MGEASGVIIVYGRIVVWTWKPVKLLGHAYSSSSGAGLPRTPGSALAACVPNHIVSSEPSPDTIDTNRNNSQKKIKKTKIRLRITLADKDLLHQQRSFLDFRNIIVYFIYRSQELFSNEKAPAVS